MYKRTIIALLLLAVFFMGVSVRRMHARIAHASDRIEGGKVKITQIQTGLRDPQAIPTGKVVGFSCPEPLLCYVLTEDTDQQVR